MGATKASPQVKHIFFDFDQTISRIHVFKHLASEALTETGQICKVTELDASGSWCYDADCRTVSEKEDAGETPCCWSHAALGGSVRVELLRDLFTELHSAGTRLTVITKGYVGVVRYILEKEGLLDLFEEVYGFIGQSYGVRNYDRCNQKPSKYEGSKASEIHGKKCELIGDIMARQKVKSLEAVLVEDDLDEVASVKGICQSVHVSHRTGMLPYEINTIREMAGLPLAKAPLES